MTVIQIIVGILGTPKETGKETGGKLEIRRRIKTIQITALLRFARILRMSWSSEKKCCHPDINEHY